MKICDDLRQAVLQAAIQGKLTTQRKEDGDARELLKQIAAEKAQLIKEKKIKKEKPLAEISEDEIPFDIPENWDWVYVGDIFQHNTGKALNSSVKEGVEKEYITTSNLYWNRFELDKLKKMPFTDTEIDRCTIKKGDLLVCEGGDYGRAAIWNYEFEMRIQNHIHRLRPYLAICIKYFYYIFYFYKQVGMIGGKGIGIQGLSSNALHKIVIPLPPLAEQHRIVAKVEKLMAEIDELEKVENELHSLKTAFPGAMKAALLQAAMQGKLTTQRKEDGDARELLEQIAKEKAQLIKENKIKKEKPLSKITEGEIPFDVPENWIWCRLGDLISVYGGLAYNKTNLSVSHNEMITVLRGGNILDLSYAFFDNDVKISPEFVKKEDLYLKKNQLITPAVTSLENLGKMARIERDYNNVVAGGFVLNIIPVLNEDIFSKYLLYMLSMPVMRARYAEIATKSGQAFYNLSRYKLLDSIIPLPPLAEQQRIVVKLEKLLPLCDGLAEE